MILLAACVAHDDGDAATVADAPFPDVEAPSSEPAWDAAAIEAAWATATARGFPEVDRPRDAWLELLSHGDGTCPAHADYLADTELTGCTATTGYTYAGDGGYLDVDEPDQGYSGWQVHADAIVTDPDGASLWVGGHVYHMDAADADGPYIQEEIEGTWRWEGDDAWLADWVSGLLTMTVRDTLQLEGALTFVGLSMSASDFTLDAQGGATGTLSFRDPDGGWHAVAFDGDACGPVVFDGREDLGEACFDFTPLLDVWASR